MKTDGDEVSVGLIVGIAEAVGRPVPSIVGTGVF